MDRRDLLKTAALLLGASISSSCSRAIVSGASLAGLPAGPVLDERQLRKVATIAELIIPETDTPGAIAAGVPEFIHRIVAEWYTPGEREMFLTGLAGVDVVSRTLFGRQFLASSAAQQSSVLHALQTAPPGPGPHGSYGPFFASIKELTVLGYYTSEVGSRHELAYRPVPGAYDGHAHVSDNSRQGTP